MVCRAGACSRRILELQKKSVCALHKGNHIIQCLLTGLGMPMGVFFSSQIPTGFSGCSTFYSEYKFITIIIFFIEIELAEYRLAAQDLHINGISGIQSKGFCKNQIIFIFQLFVNEIQIMFVHHSIPKHGLRSGGSKPPPYVVH